MTNLSIQDRINQELNKIFQALQQLEIFLRELSHQSNVGSSVCFMQRTGL
jgi:hypothetical protein